MNGKKISITRGIQKSKRRELNRLERANTSWLSQNPLLFIIIFAPLIVKLFYYNRRESSFLYILVNC